MAANSKLITLDLPYAALEREIKKRLKVELEEYAEKMKRNVPQNAPPTPDKWITIIQEHIQVEDLGEGFGGITFGIGLHSGAPEQALWMGYIYNFGSGQLGKRQKVIVSRAEFYDVNEDVTKTGLGEGVKEYPQFAKAPNKWFDDVVDKEMSVFALTEMMERVVNESVKTLFTTGEWKLKGHRLSFTI